ncbi:MAG: hypothetical protein AB1656_22640 [Candidatus Omnitrophota bacterium]
MNKKYSKILYYLFVIITIPINTFTKNNMDQISKIVYLGDIIPPFSWISKEDYEIIKELYIGMNHDKFVSITKNIHNLRSKYHRISFDAELPPEIYIKKYDNITDSPSINLVFRIDDNYIMNGIDFYYKDLYSSKINASRSNIVHSIHLLLKNLGEPTKYFHTILNPEHRNIRESLVVMEWDVNALVKLVYSFSPIEDLQGNPLLINIQVSPIEKEYISTKMHKNIINGKDTPYKTYIEEARKLVKESNKQ